MFEKMCGLDSVPTLHDTGNPTSVYIVEHSAEQEIVSNLLSQSTTELNTLFERLQIHPRVQHIVEDNVDLFMNPPEDFVDSLSSLLVPWPLILNLSRTSIALYMHSWSSGKF